MGMGWYFDSAYCWGMFSYYKESLIGGEMVTDLLKLLKDCGIKSVSIGAIIGFVLSIGIVFAGTEYRYMQRSEGQQIQLNQQYEIEDRLLTMEMRAQGMTQEQIDAVMKTRWETRIKEMKGN